MVDFKEEVLKIKEEMIEDIKTLCAIPSVQEDSSVAIYQPFGKPCRDALDAMLAIGVRDGFVVENVDGYAGHIDIGEGDNCFGVLGHLDVVPVNPVGWNSNPFSVMIKDDVLYGRGVADDKGPLLAGYYAAKIIHQLQLPTKMKMRIIFGCNEEMGSQCVKYYFSKKPFPVMGFTPDGNFPVVYGEKAGCNITIKGMIEKNGLIAFCAGTRANIVPETCSAIVEGNYKQFKASFENFIHVHNLQGTIEEEGNHTKLTMVGKSAHGSTPKIGINASVYMAKYLHEVTDNALVAFINKYLDTYTGASLGIDYTGMMGPLTMNLGVVKYRKDSFEIVLDLRCPHDMNFDAMVKKVQVACEKYGFSESHEIGKALYVDPNSTLITKLHNAYVEVTGDTSVPQAIGGGTYAKAMPNCVAFGPAFIHDETNIHENNECISIESLLNATEIYVRAMYSLIKKD